MLILSYGGYHPTNSQTIRDFTCCHSLQGGKLCLYLHASHKEFSTWFIFVTFEALLLEPYWLSLQGERMLQWFKIGRLIQGALMHPIHSICVPSIALIIWVKQLRQVQPSQVCVCVFCFFNSLWNCMCCKHGYTRCQQWCKGQWVDSLWWLYLCFAIYLFVSRHEKRQGYF